MADLSGFQRGQIVGARVAGASVTETSRMLGVSRGTVSIHNLYESIPRRIEAEIAAKFSNTAY